MKFITRSLFITFAAFLISMRFVSFDQSETSKFIEIDRSPLVVFGESVFNKEGCITCHTLRIENDSLNKISLDGYGGMRSTFWLYSILNQPRDIIYSATMPSFSHLDYNQMSKSILPALFEINKAEEIDSIWSLILAESEEISNEINDYKFKLNKNHIYKNHNTEMIALIAFLKQIPSSNEKIRLDSLANVKMQLELAQWDELYKNSDSLILQLSSDKSNVGEGKLIFENNCAVCHGTNGRGEIGPDLTDQHWLYGNTNGDIMKTIVFGTENGMPNNKYRLTPVEIGKLVAYINSIQAGKSKNAKALKKN